MTTPRLIKKYKNRRLYDLETSQFITIDDVQRYVIDGLLFQVVDAVSGRDITNATLLQIFVEIEGGATEFFSSDILRQLIVMAHHPMHVAFKSLLEKMILSMNNASSQNVYPSEYQQALDVWSQHTQQLLNQWKAMF